MILAIAFAAGLLHRADLEVYYRAVQEDGALEWMTVWAFLAAALAFAAAGRRQQLATRRAPWFLWGVALFAVVFALEEISWGQRILGYRPPAYFLRENFQQEVNIHNVLPTPVRMFLVKGVILGYGVLLPLLALPRGGRRLLSGVGVTSPPVALVPAFLATFYIYEAYPWRFAGEQVELMLGLGFLYSGLAAVLDPDPKPQRRGRLQAAVVSTALVAVLGVASVGATQLTLGDSTKKIAVARTELDALAEDFVVDGRPITRCGIHKRVFSAYEKYDYEPLRRGRFMSLVEAGLPEQRAEFFIDPWNTPFWIRHKCTRGRQREVVFLYSFGPDRSRDSSTWEILEDDLGVVIFEHQPASKPREGA